jgi:hypothetical protein
MSRTLVLFAVLSLAMPGFSAPPGSLPMQHALAGAQILAMLPAQKLAQIPPSVIDAVLLGDIPAERFAASLGLASPATAMGTPTDLQTKQFITHWLSRYLCLVSRIDQDYVDEASINGRCSGQNMSDGPSAPFLYPTYYPNASGAIITGYWQAPTDLATGVTLTTDLSRYFVTWVKSPTTRSVKLWFGASDYFKLWVNRVLVLLRTAGGSKSFTVDEYKANVTLTAGWNLIVLKQSFPQLGPATDPSDDNKIKALSLRFVSDDAGTPITDLVAAFDPNCTEADPPLDTKVFVPNVAHLPGYSSQWRTDVCLFNGTHMNWSHRLRFYKEGNNSGIPDGEKYLEMTPHQTLTFPDVLQTLFGITTSVKGYVTVLQQVYSKYSLYSLPESGWLQARTFNLADSGSYGTLNPLLYGYSGILSPVAFFGLRNGAFRTNLAMFPVVNSGATTSIRLTLFGPDLPVPLVKQYWGINGFWQLNNVFDDLGAGNVNTDSAVLYLVFLDDPTGTYWFPYVTVLDGNPKYGVTGTSDPVYVGPGYFLLLPPILNQP